jgi:hypothetical protein
MRIAVAIGLLAATVDAQHASRPASAPATNRAVVPFGVGERTEYDLRFGRLKVGTGVSEVLKVDSIRGREAWHTVFRVRGGIPGFRVNDRFESWIDVTNLASLRHWQDIDEGPNERERRYEIFPDERLYVENERAPLPSVELPLDDGSFLFFIRTIPLEVGQAYSFDRYFRPDRNPVRIEVLRREQITVPAGTFDALVIRPIIKSRGVFAENGRAEVWIRDDSTRILLQIKSHLKFGSLNLYLKSYRPAQSMPDSARAGAR